MKAITIKLFACVFLLYGLTIRAQQPKTMKASYFTKSAYVREVPALSKMDNIIAAAGFEHVAPPKRRGTNIVVEGKGLPVGKDPLVDLQKSLTKRTINRTPVANFLAHQGTVLNDPTGAIGPNHYVYAFNSGFGILDRSGNVLVPEASLGTLFPGETLGDPIVVYDNYEDRFIIMEFSNSPNGILIAVCQGPDPVNDGWYTYRFNTGSFPDYEKLSIWSDGYYITANKDQNSASTSEVVYALERDQMLVGGDAQMIGFPLPGIVTSGFYSPGGFNSTGPSLPPVGVGHQIVYMQDDSWSGVSNDHLKIWTTSVNWNNPNSSSITLSQELSTASYDGVFDNGSFQNLDEPGNGPDIDALQATMMYMTNYRRFGTHNSVVLNFVVDISGNDSEAGIRWMELRQTSDGQPWSVYQEGTYTDPNGHSAFSGSIIMDGQGNIGMGYTIVSTSQYTSLRYTGRLAGDALGVMTQGEGFIIDGDEQNNRTDGRYGDYAQITIDPVDDITFWHIGEYMQGSSSTVRKSRVAAFQFGNAVLDDEAPSTPTNLSVAGVTSTTVSLSWTASTDNVGVTAYDIYSGSSVVASVGNTTSATITGLTPSTSYSFSVVAKDAAGNESSQSSSVSATTAEPSAGCEGGISTFPYAESFENTLGAWTQSDEDDLDWTVDASGTPSSNTGPSGAADGTYYIYVEASGNGTGYPDKSAIINSPCFDLSGLSDAVFSFDYHMFGSNDMGSIDLEVSTDDGLTWSSIWNQTGNQGNSWLSESIDLSAYVGSGIKLRFNRLVGGTWQADIAIDNITLTEDGDVTPPPSDCYSNSLSLSITLDNYPEETSWALVTNGTTVASESYSNSNPDGSTVTENITGLASGDYTFTINDSYGDGICCGYGNGSYTLSSGSQVIVSGGDFDSSESTDFCVDGLEQAQVGRSLETQKLSFDDDNQYRIYPVPVGDVLSIEGAEKVDDVMIFSMFGKVVGEFDKNKGYDQLDISNLTAGTYFIRITAGEQIVTRKFIKE